MTDFSPTKSELDKQFGFKRPKEYNNPYPEDSDDYNNYERWYFQKAKQSAVYGDEESLSSIKLSEL